MATELKSGFDIFQEIIREKSGKELAWSNPGQWHEWTEQKTKEEAARYADREYGIKFTSWIIFVAVMLIGAKYFPEQTGLFLILLILSLVFIHSAEVISWTKQFKL